jgi:Haem-binding domain
MTWRMDALHPPKFSKSTRYRNDKKRRIYMKKAGRIILILLGAALVLFILIQLIPFGRNHINPPVIGEPNWDSSATRELAKRACFDCHSNETVWPWYSNIAPVSWLVYADVAEGRNRMNFSEWNSNFHPDVNELVGVIQESEMPPFQYLILHPNANLSATDRQALISGLQKSIP